LNPDHSESNVMAMSAIHRGKEKWYRFKIQHKVEKTLKLDGTDPEFTEHTIIKDMSTVPPLKSTLRELESLDDYETQKFSCKLVKALSNLGVTYDKSQDLSFEDLSEKNLQTRFCDFFDLKESGDDENNKAISLDLLNFFSHPRMVEGDKLIFFTSKSTNKIVMCAHASPTKKLKYYLPEASITVTKHTWTKTDMYSTVVLSEFDLLEVTELMSVEILNRYVLIILCFIFFF